MRTFSLRPLSLTLTLWSLSLPGCHPAGLTTGATPVPEQLMAEGVLHVIPGGFTHAFVPVTIHGQSMTASTDLGAPVGIFGVTQASTAIEFGIPITDITTDSAGVSHVDSLTIGTSVVRNVTIRNVTSFSALEPGPDMPFVVGTLGSHVLSHFDLLFDGPARRLRLYAPPSSTATAQPTRHQAWLPPGLTLADCVPLVPVAMKPPFPGESVDDLVGMPVQVNGHTLSAFFDSGSDRTYMNLAMAKQLGIDTTSPNVHLLPADSSFGFAGEDQLRKMWAVSGVSITVGGHHLATVPIEMMENNMPNQLRPDDPAFALGLNSLSNALFFISFSTRQVCVG